MKVECSAGSIEAFDGDTVVVNLLDGVAVPGGATAAIDAALGGAIRELIGSGDVKGTAGATRVLYPRGAVPASRVIVVGLGPVDGLGPEAVRRAAAAAARAAREYGARRLGTVVHGAGAGGMDAAAAARATVEGTLASLRAADDDGGPTQVVLVEHDAGRLEAVRRGAAVGTAMAEGAALARDLVRQPANVATPAYLADVATRLSEQHGFAVTVGDRAWIEEQGMGGLEAVARGAGFEPRFIVLEHRPRGTAERPVVLVGKGITFDSGGLTIKPRAGMAGMNRDMAGAAAVLGAMSVVGTLAVQRPVIAVVPATENVIDARGFRPTDVLRALDGTTIEVVSTDAEGRLILADALAYAARFEPVAVVDIATLTGGVVTALGRHAAGLFTADDGLAAGLQAAGDATGERLWRMPLWPEYREGLTSDVADIKNSTGAAPGSACVAAAFLERFTSYPWAHLDIAGVHSTERGDGARSKGPTGFGVRLLCEWILRGPTAATQGHED